MSVSKVTADSVSLQIDGELFQASKELLSQHSAYFSAMFSGSYREAGQDVVCIEIIKAKSMKIILSYMSTGVVDLSDLSYVADLITAANYLQVQDLAAVVENDLIKKIGFDSWADILEASKSADLQEVAERAACFGLYSFDSMMEHVDSIKTLHTLQWYLSHSHLTNNHELQAFEFGEDWIEHHKPEHPDVILIVLGCLAVESLVPNELAVMSESKVVERHGLANAMVSCMRRVLQKHSCLNAAALEAERASLAEDYDEDVLREVGQLVAGSFGRSKSRSACIAVYRHTPDAQLSFESDVPAQSERHFLFCWSDKCSERWMGLAVGQLWGWSWAPWGARHVVMSGGEYGRGTGRFERCVRVWDAVRDVSVKHYARLPPRRHAGVVVHGNTLYLVGGIGAFRIKLSSVLSYDLITRKSCVLPDLPETVQSPAVAVHRDELYAAGHHSVYVLRESWIALVKLPTKPNFLLSIWNQLCFTQSYQSELMHIDLETRTTKTIYKFSDNVAGICNTGRGVSAFTENPQNLPVGMEVYGQPNDQCEPIENITTSMSYLGVAGCGAVALDEPPIVPALAATYSLAHLRRIQADGKSAATKVG